MHGIVDPVDLAGCNRERATRYRKCIRRRSTLEKLLEEFDISRKDVGVRKRIVFTVTRLCMRERKVHVRDADARNISLAG